MSHLRKIAAAYYKAGSSEFQSAAQTLFNVLDKDGDGHISVLEFLSVMTEGSTDKERAINKYRNLFNELDCDRNGTLDFWEVMTLLYILMSKRPFCDCCEKFIPGAHFTCVQCHADVKTQFDLCIHCYENRRWTEHKHNGQPAHFLDNYSLLDAKRGGSGLNTDTNENNLSHTSTSRALASGSRGIVKGKAFLDALSNVPDVLDAVVNIVGNCTIM